MGSDTVNDKKTDRRMGYAATAAQLALGGAMLVRAAQLDR